MKLTKRNPKYRIVSPRITSPETRNNPETGKRELLLSFIDDNSNQQHLPTTKDLFLYAAGTNEEGELPDGLDRLAYHRFVIHVDDNKRAVGLDVIPARVYRSQVIPASQLNVTTVKLTWEVNGTVCRILQRPAGTKADELETLIKAFDKLASTNTAVTSSTKFPGIGKVVNIDGNIVEVKLSNGRGRGEAVYDILGDDQDS
jgi:hypothetical protein